MYYQSKAEIEDHIREAGEQAVEANRRVPPELVKILGRLLGRARPERPQAHARGRAPGGIMAVELDAGVRTAAGGAAPRPRQGAHTRDRGIARADLGRVREALRRVGQSSTRSPRTTTRSSRRRWRPSSSSPPTRSRGPGPVPAATRSRTTSSVGGARGDRGPQGRGGEGLRAPGRPRDPRHRQAGRDRRRRRRAPLHEIAREIETELEYPGQIKVTVIRESRSTELAK